MESDPAAPAVAPPARARAITLGHVAVVGGGAISLLPWISGGVALLMGAAAALLFGNPLLARTRRASKTLLTVAVIGLGASMDVRVVARSGAQGLVYTMIGIAGCLGLGLWLARRLRVEGRTGLLISAGTAICGGSAIAAVAPVVRARDEEVSIALGTVFLLNALALFLFPALGHALGLDERRFGLWAALAIHDTSSVVGATLAYGPHAVEVGTIVKLTRALWIAPVAFGLGLLVRSEKGDRGKSPKPWFLAGFVLAALLTTFIPVLQPAGALVATGARRLMVLTLFLIGCGLTRSALRAVGVRPLVHGVVLWAVVGSATLGALLAGWIQ